MGEANGPEILPVPSPEFRIDDGPRPVAIPIDGRVAHEIQRHEDWLRGRRRRWFRVRIGWRETRHYLVNCEYCYPPRSSYVVFVPDLAEREPFAVPLTRTWWAIDGRVVEGFVGECGRCGTVYWG